MKKRLGSTVKAHINESFFVVRLVKVLKLWSFDRTFCSNGQKLLLVAVQSGKCHTCFKESFLLKMGFEISGWRFLKFWFFYAGFYCIYIFNFKSAYYSRLKSCKLNYYPVFSSFWRGGSFVFQLHTLRAVKLVCKIKNTGRLYKLFIWIHSL